MKILFIVKDIDYIDSIGIMTISALVKSKNHSSYLGIIEREDVIKKIDELGPDVIAYSASTGEHKHYLRINEIIKSEFENIFTVMGGAHPTFYPDCIKKTSLDAICVGEGDAAFLELLDSLGNGASLEGIRNIVARNAKDGISIRELNENLDSLPFPDRRLFYDETEMGRFPLKSFVTSRGCPYLCTYCFNHAFRKLYQGKGRNVRRHSVDYVLDQILEVKGEYPLEFVKFYDDIFVYSIDGWFEEFVRKYKRAIGLPFHCLTRADLLTDDIARLLKEAGCHSISMSIEAGSPYFRNEVLKRNMSEEQVTSAFHICEKYDIKTFSNNIVGLPFARIEDEIATLDLNLKCRVSFAEFPIFHPYPRTELGNFCIKNEIYESEYGDLHMSYMNKSPLSCFSAREKNIQRNLSRLGVVIVLFPFLRNIFLRYLIYLPYNVFFFLSYYLAKAYMINRRIYPFEMPLKDLLRLFFKSIRLEHFKLSDERNLHSRYT